MARMYARIDGRRVPVEVYEPEDERGFASNPGTREAILAGIGVGMGVYNIAKGVVGYIPNPEGGRLKRSLPWAAVAGIGWFVAPKLGRLKVPVRVVSAGVGIKALFEYFK